MLAALPGSTTAALVLAGGLAVIAGGLALSRWMIAGECNRAQAHASAYLMLLILLRLRSTPSDLHYLNRLVEDLGVDQQTLEQALGGLERRKLVIRHTDNQRGAYFRLTPAGSDWRPRPGRLRRSVG